MSDTSKRISQLRDACKMIEREIRKIHNQRRDEGLTEPDLLTILLDDLDHKVFQIESELTRRLKGTPYNPVPSAPNPT